MPLPILNDFPDAFETARLLIRPPLPGDGPELNAATLESLDRLRPWLPWAREAPTLEASEANARRARCAFLERSDLRLHLLLKGTDTLVGSSGLHRIDWSVPRPGAAASWFDIPEARAALSGDPLTMQQAWLEQVGPVSCELCGRPVRAGERFRLTPYCPMGGRLELAPEALDAFADTLEVSARHVSCSVTPDR
jgi:hypothetical protein